MPQLSQQERIEKLEKLEELLKQFVLEQKERLELEKEFLELVLEKQGFTSAARRNANSDKLTALATVKQLLPTIKVT